MDAEASNTAHSLVVLLDALQTNTYGEIENVDCWFFHVKLWDKFSMTLSEVFVDHVNKLILGMEKSLKQLDSPYNLGMRFTKRCMSIRLSWKRNSEITIICLSVILLKLFNDSTFLCRKSGIFI